MFDHWVENDILNITLIVWLIWSTLSWVKDDEHHAYSFNRYFWSVEDNNDEKIEEEGEEEEEDDDDEDPEEEEEKAEDTSSSEEVGEADDDDEPDPWSPLRQNVGEDLKET